MVSLVIARPRRLSALSPQTRIELDISMLVSLQINITFHQAINSFSSFSVRPKAGTSQQQCSVSLAYRNCSVNNLTSNLEQLSLLFLIRIVSSLDTSILVSNPKSKISFIRFVTFQNLRSCIDMKFPWA